VDGPVNVIVNIAQIAQKQNLAEVELLVPKYPEIVELDGVKVHRCKSIKAADGYRACVPMLDKSVKNLIKNGGWDLIHIHSPFTLGRAVTKYAKKYNIPTLFTMHTSYKIDFERLLKSSMLQKFMMNYIMKTINGTNYMSSVSNGSALMLREYGYKGENIEVIRNGADMKPVKIDQTIINDIKNKYGLENCFTFLFVGRIVENKNIQFSLKVLKQLKELGENNFKFLIVGDGAYLDNLKRIASDYGLDNEIVFVGKVVDREYLSGIYQVSDLFLFPSVYDTCGIVAIEAAVNNLASAMIENSCASEVVEHKVNGLSMIEDSDVWASIIKEVMNDKKLLNSMREKARETIYVSWLDVVKKYIDHYDYCIKEYNKKK